MLEELAFTEIEALKHLFRIRNFISNFTERNFSNIFFRSVPSQIRRKVDANVRAG